MPNKFKSIIRELTGEADLGEKVVILFEKIRDIPYGNIGSRNPLDVYSKNKGTCSGKHELLKSLYKEMGIPTQDFIITHKFKDLPVDFPQNIREILDKTEINDPHNFFKIKIDEKWITIDITWDIALKKLGFLVNENWDGKSDTSIAVALGGDIYETNDPIALKKELISKLPENVQKERKLFLTECTKWLDSLREENKI